MTATQKRYKAFIRDLYPCDTDPIDTESSDIILNLCEIIKDINEEHEARPDAENIEYMKTAANILIDIIKEL